MIRSTMRSTTLVALLLAATFSFAQTEFSADMVNTANNGNAVQAKMYFGKDKIRIEPTASTGHGMGGAVIMDLTAQTSTVLMQQQQMYMVMPAQMASQRNAYNFFRTGDAENACADWLAQERNKGGTCRKVGSDTVNGRDTVKYEGTSATGETTTVWLDPKLRFPIKWQRQNGSGELRNIQEGSQPASLFEIPAGFRKMDMGNMGGMMQRPQ
jgi:hypothetical protein